MAQAVVGEPGFGLHCGRIGHAALPWPTLSVASDRGVDQPRVAGSQRLIVEPEIAQCASAEILDNDVRSVAQAQRQFAGPGHVQVNANIAFAGVLLRVVAGHARCRGKREARNVGTRRLDLDDLGAKIQQCAGAERTGEHAREIDNADAGEGAAHVSGP